MESKTGRDKVIAARDVFIRFSAVSDSVSAWLRLRDVINGQIAAEIFLHEIHQH